MRTVLQEPASTPIGRARPVTPVPQLRVEIDGKFFRAGDMRLPFRGVTYGTFMPRASDGARFPERPRLASDLDAMADAGFTVVRTYTTPPEDLLQLAGERGLRILAGVFYPDWRYLVGDVEAAGTARRRRRAHRGRACRRELAGRPEVLGLCLGNEVPADVVRWTGTTKIAWTIAGLADAVHDVDDGQLVTYANYPSAEYLPLDDLDFLTFNVFLERRADFRRYLTKLQHLAGDRPLVLGEMGLAVAGAGGEARQAEVLDWQLETALERGAGPCVFSWTDEWWVGDAAVEGWHFGLTRADRSPRPALDTVRRWNGRRVADLDFDWPSMSVVICAYNAAATLDECLHHTCALDYPDLEVIVVDDGSSDATAEIARAYPRARLESIPHAGLSVARNHGYEVARGDVVAYLDSDAYPDPDWPYYLALGFDGPTLGGVGGPNVPPRADSDGADQVTRCSRRTTARLAQRRPGRAHPRVQHGVLARAARRAGWLRPRLHIRGRRRRPVLAVARPRAGRSGSTPPRSCGTTGGRACVRISGSNGDTGGARRSWRRATRTGSPRTGTARWRGRIYDSFPAPLHRQRIYRGVYGGAAYQSVYRGAATGSTSHTRSVSRCRRSFLRPRRSPRCDGGSRYRPCSRWCSSRRWRSSTSSAHARRVVTAARCASGSVSRR